MHRGELRLRPYAGAIRSSAPVQRERQLVERIVCLADRQPISSVCR